MIEHLFDFIQELFKHMVFTALSLWIIFKYKLLCYRLLCRIRQKLVSAPCVVNLWFDGNKIEFEIFYFDGYNYRCKFKIDPFGHVNGVTLRSPEYKDYIFYLNVEDLSFKDIIKISCKNQVNKLTQKSTSNIIRHLRNHMVIN